MSKQIVNISSLLSFMLLLSGCGQETSLVPLPGNGEQEPVEIRLNASLAEISVEVTRTDATMLMPNGSRIGLYGMRNSGDLPGNNPYIDNWEFVTDADGAMSNPDHAKVYFPAGREQAFLYAYSPYTTSVKVMADGKVGIPVKSDLADNPTESPWNTEPWTHAATDLLYAYDDPIHHYRLPLPDNPLNENAYFIFKHALAKLNILVSTSSATESYQLNSIAVTFSNGQYGYMNLTDGKITPEASSTKTFTVGYDPSQTIISNTTDQAQFSHIVIPPATITDNAIEEIKITANGTEYIVYEATSGPVITLTASMQKTLHIKFNPDNQAHSSLIDWDNDVNQDIDYNR